MAVSKPIQVRVSDEIGDALREWCEANDTALSDLLRDAALTAIGRDDLVGAMRWRGQPAKVSQSSDASAANEVVRPTEMTDDVRSIVREELDNLLLIGGVNERGESVLHLRQYRDDRIKEIDSLPI